MRDYIISTDSTADLPEEYIKEHKVAIHPLYYIVNGVQYGGQNAMDTKTFYGFMRNAVEISTSATNPDVIAGLFENQVKEGFDVLHISFSSGLSCSYNNASVMARDVCENHPEARIEVIDSLSASLGQGLLVWYAVKLKEAGHTMDEVISWIEANKLHICHEFTVDDLKYLFRGGRVSRAVAILGSLINVKPVLHMDNAGLLVPLFNVRGRKKALNALVDNMAERVGEYQNDMFFISHCDCEADAQLLASLVKERFSIDAKIINGCSPTIGAHSGPGTIALFHMGQTR